MRRFTAFCTAAALFAGGAARAELTVVEDQDQGLEVYRLTVTPAAEPSPALKHRLMTPPHQLKRGNAPAHYRRAHAENNLDGARRNLNEATGDQWYGWINADIPIGQLPLDELRTSAPSAQRIVDNFVGPGTLCRRCDWGLAIEDLQGPETIVFLLPEFQGMRELTRMTALATRLAIAERRYTDAIDLMRMNYRMGRDTGEVPILVCSLIGIAMVGITSNNALDLIAAPDSPNLYWALGELPDPIVPVRDAVRLEMSIGTRVAPLLAEAETANYSPEEWNRRWRETVAMFFSGGLTMGVTVPQPGAELAAVPLGIAGYPHAKRRLVDWGYDDTEVEAMAVGQVLAIYTARALQIHADNVEKHFYLPFSAARNRAQAADARASHANFWSDDPDREILPVAALLLPAVSACRNAEMRVRREMALLRAIEAVRMHAALTDELPASLNQITCVPVPDNPATGEPFQFEREQANFVFGDEAAQTGSVTFVLPRSDGFHLDRRYEIRLAAGN